MEGILRTGFLHGLVRFQVLVLVSLHLKQMRRVADHMSSRHAEQTTDVGCLYVAYKDPCHVKFGYPSPADSQSATCFSQPAHKLEVLNNLMAEMLGSRSYSSLPT